MNRRIGRFVLEVLAMFVGCTIYASAVICIMQKNDMAPGGVSGIAVMIHYLNHKIPVGVVYFAMNIPILVLGIVCLSRKFMCYTVIATMIIAGVSDGLNTLAAKGIFQPQLTDIPILAAVYGGVFMGVGIGIVMRAGGSTGGTDIIVKVIRVRNKQFRTGILYLITDILIIACSALVFQNIEAALYAGIGSFISAKVMDLVLYGSDETKMFFIISDHYQVIAKRLLLEIDTGVTYLEGHGAYTGEERRVMLCMIKKHHFSKAREIVAEEDKNAFMVISSATEVFGEGYKRHEAEDL